MPQEMRISRSILIVLSLAGVAAAQEKKDDKKEPPKITAVTPLAVKPGETAKLKIRGMKLDKATKVRLIDTAAGVKVEQKKAGTADGGKDDKTKGFGDSVVEAELTVPKDHAGGEVKLAVVTPDGESIAVPVAVVPADQLVDEKESNGGFRTAQSVPSSCIVRGTIGEEKDVDVFRITGKAGQTLTAKVKAADAASVLDASLTLYTARGQILQSVDDRPPSRDPVLEFRLPADGEYLIALIDAHDRGSVTTHPYLLHVEVK